MYLRGSDHSCDREKLPIEQPSSWRLISFRRRLLWEKKSIRMSVMYGMARTHTEKNDWSLLMKTDKRIQNLVLIALFAALTFIGTMIKIPLPTGAFIHFGNAVVLLGYS
jgi:hypothetical protein